MKKNIDIVVGGQFGDEGKGQVCAHLVHKNLGDPDGEYAFAVRVGGSNAEHRFETPDGVRHTGRVLPVAGWIDSEIKMVLGAGHMIKLDSFLKEVKELESIHGDQTGRIYIDPQAGVIDPKHTRAGEMHAWRGSTHQGTGQAVAAKVVRDGLFKTASKYAELKEYVRGSTVELMADWMKDDQRGLLEGSQGALLSLNHGYYPYCTSKDVTPAALLAEAGIPTGRVRDTWAVYRTVSMRVPGNSGPSKGEELEWEKLEELIGHPIPEDAKIQTDSGDRERVFLWSWEEYVQSIALIGPTHAALTFADWWPVSKMQYNSVDGHMKDMAYVGECRVQIVRNGPRWGDYTWIDY